MLPADVAPADAAPAVVAPADVAPAVVAPAVPVPVAPTPPTPGLMFVALLALAIPLDPVFPGFAVFGEWCPDFPSFFNPEDLFLSPLSEASSFKSLFFEFPFDSSFEFSLVLVASLSLY